MVQNVYYVFLNHISSFAKSPKCLSQFVAYSQPFGAGKLGIPAVHANIFCITVSLQQILICGLKMLIN